MQGSCVSEVRIQYFSWVVLGQMELRWERGIQRRIDRWEGESHSFLSYDQ